MSLVQIVAKDGSKRQYAQFINAKGEVKLRPVSMSGKKRTYKKGPRQSWEGWGARERMEAVYARHPYAGGERARQGAITYDMNHASKKIVTNPRYWRPRTNDLKGVDDGNGVYERPAYLANYVPTEKQLAARGRFRLMVEEKAIARRRMAGVPEIPAKKSRVRF